MYACEAGAVSILDLILKAEPKRPLAINMRDKNGHSALYLAAKGGHITVVQMLLQRKDIDVNSADGVRLLHVSMNAMSLTLFDCRELVLHWAQPSRRTIQMLQRY